MTSKREITIYDLARELNISTATVSRALNNHPSVSKKTRKKISELAKATGYQQNNFASNLRKQKTHTIGVIIHELNSRFIVSALSGIEKVITAANYNIIIGHSAETSSKEAANALNLFHKRVDGLIASLAYDTENLDHYEPFLKKDIPVVFFDRVKKDSAGIKIVIDNFKAGYEATTHLLQQGCKRLVHITGNLMQNVYADRWKGFQSALADNNLPCLPEQLIVNDLDEKAGIEAARQILDMPERPDGIFVTNDLCAVVCMQKLKEGGLKVPEDIAIVGFNNDLISRIAEPALTTINYAGMDMGEVAAKCLINQLNHNKLPDSNYTITLPAALLIRTSSLKKKL